jgi:hypothetical protein
MSAPRARKAARRPPARRRPATGRDFWGLDGADEGAIETIRPTDDPAAMIKSLGRPPVHGFEPAAEQYFEAVYEKAVALAVALAAANGLLDAADVGADEEA